MGNSGNPRVRRAVLIAAVLAGLGIGTPVGEAGELAGELVLAAGPVEIRPLAEGVWRAATVRAVLRPGDMVRTGPGGAAEVALAFGIVRLTENTVVILPPSRPVPATAGAAPGLRLLLYQGRALFHVLRERLQGSFDVITPSVIVGVKGTTFGVAQGARTGVVVFEGRVQVVPTGGPTTPPVTVGAGQFTVLEQGRLTQPQPFLPAAPSALWGDEPTDIQSAPLAVAPAGPEAPGGGTTVEDRMPGADAGGPALAEVGEGPGSGATAPAAPEPPRLTAVGGPPGLSDVLATTALEEDPGGKASGSGKGRCNGKGRGLGASRGRGRGGDC